MERKLNENQKHIYLSILGAVWVLLIASLYTLVTYKSWYLLAGSVLGLIILFSYQKHLGIRLGNKYFDYLEELSPKNRSLVYLSTFVTCISASFLGYDIRFLFLLAIAGGYQLFLAYKMVERYY